MNLAALVGGIGGFIIGGPAGAAAGAALGSKLSGSSDENVLKDAAAAFTLGISPVGGAVKGGITGFMGTPGAGPQGLGGFSQAVAGAKKGFMAGIPSALGGTGGPISPSKALLGLTALSAFGSGDQGDDATERFPGGERNPNYQPQTLVRPFRSKITGKRYFTLEDMLRDEGKDVPDQPVGIASAAQPAQTSQGPMFGNMLSQFAINNPQLLGSPSMPGMLMANEGGYIEGPGTGRSDSVKAGIFQNGQKVQEARLSDGEFVMTRKAVDNAGGGDREKGAARMYALMNDLENKRVA
jgi:hypothetical protein